MSSKKDLERDKETLIKDEFLVTNPSAIPIAFHDKKNLILKLLIKNEMTIIDLKHKTGMNPGTIKRHLNDLLEFNLIYISREQISDYGIVMKFYRATAKRYKFELSWP